MSMIIPEDLKLLNAQPLSSAVVERQNITLYPVGSTDASSNYGSISGQFIEFVLPAQGNKTYDMSTFFVHFNFKINVTGVTKTNPSHVRCFVQDSIESIIKGVDVFIGGSNQVLERIDNYGCLETMLNYYVSDSYMKTFGSRCMHAGLSSTQRNQLYSNQNTAATSFTTNTVQCSVPLRALGVSNPSLNLPSSIFGGIFCRIRIELQAPNMCIYAQQETAIALSQATGVISGGTATDFGSVSTNLNYTLSNIRATVDTITYSNEYAQMLNQALASSKLTFPVKSWDVQIRSVNAGVRRVTESLAFNYSSVDALFFWFNRQDELNTFAKAGLDRLWYLSMLESIQLKINGRNFPQQPIDLQNGSSESYVHLIEALGQIDSVEVIGPNSYLSPNQITTTSNITATLFYSNPISSHAQGDNFYGRNRPVTAGATQNVSDATYNNCLMFNFGTTPAHTCTSGHFNPFISEMTPSSYVIGINVRKLITQELGVTSGEDLSASAGLISYQIDFNANTDTNYNLNVAVLHNRFINVQGQKVDVAY